MPEIFSAPTDTSVIEITPQVVPSGTSTELPTATPQILPVLQHTASPSYPLTEDPTNTPSPSATQAPIKSPTPTITSTYAILRGKVLEQSNCRYGPGAAYLYKYGLYKDNTLEVIGRNQTGTWVVVQAIGGNNPCWIKASLMSIRGDAMTLAPATLPLPQSPYYGPLTGVTSVRDGDRVIISWNSLILKAGDDSEQYPYLIEAWLCKDGQLSFNAIGSWETIVTVIDEPGCPQSSHAVIYGVEKHGYTRWVTIPWTQP